MASPYQDAYAASLRDPEAFWAAAAGDIAPDQEAELHAWAARRRALIDQGGSQLEVAHQDLLLLPG